LASYAQSLLQPQPKSYQHYGARGIFVEESWHGKQGFANFVRDMGERPEGGTIDRIDNNKSYSPHNCHWANAFEQAKNKRTTVGLHLTGKQKILRSGQELLDATLLQYWRGLHQA